MWKKFGLQSVKLENVILAKYYWVGKIPGDEKFPGKLIFVEEIWAAKS